MRRVLVSLLLCLPLVATGCVAPLFIEMFKDPYGRHDSLTRIQREYTNALRWGDPDVAMNYVHPELREAFVEHAQNFKQIRVTDYEVGKIEWGSEEKATAKVVVTYRAYSMLSMVEKEIRETQEWERLSENANDWVVRPKIDHLIDSVAGM